MTLTDPRADAPSAASGTAIRMTGVEKTFGSTRALKSVSLEFTAGTVNALVGENGAGKSTALGLLAGRIAPSEGAIEIFGRPLPPGQPRASRRAGVVAIYQELTIVPALSAEANVFLAEPLNRAGMLSERRMRQRYLELCASLGVAAVPPRTPAGRLSVAEQQMLEILRGFASDARIMLFDEPTASLAVAEREALHRLIRRLRDDGVTTVFVSHNLDEVLDLADTITVFRDGRLTSEGERADFTKETLVAAMLGAAGDRRVMAAMGDAQTTSDRLAARPAVDRTRPAILRVEDVTVPDAIENISVEVRAGEIVGIGGLVGAGRTTLLRAIAGLERRSRGRMWIDGVEVPWPRTARRALGYGIALVPEDRKHQGLVLAMTAAENVAVGDLGRARSRGIISLAGIVRAVRDVAEPFGFRPERLRARAWQLSGGNQQKLLLARWKFRPPRILLADEPTRGIDVGAKAEIMTALEAMAAEGVGLMIVSSELEEVTAVSDRVLVLAAGIAAGHLDRADGPITTAEILRLAFHVHDAD